MSTPSAPSVVPSAPPPGPSLSSTMGKMAEGAVGGIESSIASFGPVAFAIGIGIFVFKRGIEAILFQKNPLRPLFKDK